MNLPIILIAHNIRSAYNVGSLFRSADAFGVKKIILCGITPYPPSTNDKRLPHQKAKAAAQIAKTALGAEHNIEFEYQVNIELVIERLKTAGVFIYALEQAHKTTKINNLVPKLPCALIVGNEVDGIPQKVLKNVDNIIEIPMLGKKESLNVSVAAGIALYVLACPSLKNV